MSTEKNKINIKYIAQLLNLSTSTISRAMCDDPTIKKETKEKIIKKAKELNYYPNLIAKSLRGDKTKNIGIILNDLTNPFYLETIQTIEKILTNADYTTILCNSNYSLELERKNIITMLSKRIDGIIISPINAESENIELILENDLKAVFIDIIPNRNNINYAYVDHRRISFIATDYLIKNGHENILLLVGPHHLSSSVLFLDGYLNALKKNGLLFKKDLIKFVNLSISDSSKMLKKFFINKNKKFGINFTAVLCISDLLAIGIYEISKKLGFNIPEDYSVVGCDNILASPYLSPPLTTINYPKKRIGKISAEILLELLEKNTKEFKKIIIEPKLIERNSVKKIIN